MHNTVRRVRARAHRDMPLWALSCTTSCISRFPLYQAVHLHLTILKPVSLPSSAHSNLRCLLSRRSNLLPRPGNRTKLPASSFPSRGASCPSRERCAPMCGSSKELIAFLHTAAPCAISAEAIKPCGRGRGRSHPVGRGYLRVAVGRRG